MWNEGNVGQNCILKQFIFSLGFHKVTEMLFNLLKGALFRMEVKYKFGFGLYPLNFNLLYLVLTTQRFCGMNWNELWIKIQISSISSLYLHKSIFS